MEIQGFVLEITRQALLLTLLLSGIPIFLSMFVGVLVSVFQAATQIQEQTLTFVPKLLIVFGCLMLMGYWMLAQIVQFTDRLFNLVPHVVTRGGA